MQDLSSGSRLVVSALVVLLVLAAIWRSQALSCRRGGSWDGVSLGGLHGSLLGAVCWGLALYWRVLPG